MTTNGISPEAIDVIFAIDIKAAPDRSPNLEMNVSIKTEDLYLSFFCKALKIFSRTGLLKAYSKTLKNIVTKATIVIDGKSPYNRNAIKNKNP